MYFDIPDYSLPARQSFASVSNAIREATNAYGITANNNSTMLSIAAVFKQNRSSVTNAFSAIDMSKRILEDQAKSRQALVNSMQEAIKINWSPISLPIIKITPEVYDFRKSVAFYNAEQGLSSYFNERMSVTEAVSIENKAFDLNEGQETNVKYKQMTLDNEVSVSDLWMRINFLLRFIGVDFDYETVRCILENFVDAVKKVIDNS